QPYPAPADRPLAVAGHAGERVELLVARPLPFVARRAGQPSFRRVTGRVTVPRGRRGARDLAVGVAGLGRARPFLGVPPGPAYSSFLCSNSHWLSSRRVSTNRPRSFSPLRSKCRS